MARYRKIDVRMWGDARFQRLSSPPPCGQHLWTYLLTGPDTVNVPGLYRAGEAALAEALSWPLEGFREAFAEVLREGMAEADWRARVVWVPNAIRYNEPESPNVVRHWRIPWDEVPECELKRKAYRALRAYMEGKGEGFRKAFAEACADPSANQEQEQEQEQKGSTHTGVTCGLPAELRGQSPIKQAIPPLLDDEPEIGLVLLPELRELCESDAGGNCTDPDQQWRYWHADRMSKRSDPSTWRTDWYEDFRKWAMNHRRRGCPCQTTSRRPLAAVRSRTEGNAGNAMEFARRHGGQA